MKNQSLTQEGLILPRPCCWCRMRSGSLTLLHLLLLCCVPLLQLLRLLLVLLLQLLSFSLVRFLLRYLLMFLVLFLLQFLPFFVLLRSQLCLLLLVFLVQLRIPRIRRR